MADSRLIDANTMHALSVIRYSEQQAREFLPILKQARDYLVKKLALEGSEIASKGRLKKINRQVQKKLISIYTQYPELLEGNARDFIKQEYEFQKTSIAMAIEDAVRINTPPQKEALKAVRLTPMAVGSKGAAVSLPILFEGFAKDEAKRVTDRITMGYFQGETVEQISRALSGTKRNKFRDGILNITRSNAFALAKTGISHLQQQTKDTFYKENEDIVIGYQIIATLDSRTSQICRSYDKEIVLFKDGPGPKPPFHYNCRTTTTPVLRPELTVDFDSTRASVGGQVDSKESYYTWLKKQPAAFQDEALGRQQGKIFRNAGLSPQEFKKASVDRFHQPLTIEEMAAKNEKIREYLDN